MNLKLVSASFLSTALLALGQYIEYSICYNGVHDCYQQQKSKTGSVNCSCLAQCTNDVYPAASAYVTWNCSTVQTGTAYVVASISTTNVNGMTWITGPPYDDYYWEVEFCDGSADSGGGIDPVPC